MNKQRAELIISSWNGKDNVFLCEGEILTEDDVQEAHDFLDNYIPTRKINVTIEIEDSDHIEYQLSIALKSLLGTSMTDYKVLPDTSELYKNDSTFRALCKAKKTAKQKHNDYINAQKIKSK